MAAARLAPELSATSRMERICNIKSGAACVHGRLRITLDDFGQTPAFELGERAGFLNSNAIARLGFAFLVVGVELLVLRDDLLELAVGEAALDPDHNRLGHLIGEH